MTLVCAVALGFALAGCGKTLRTNEESLEFVVSVARGADPAEWKLADDATALAIAAWAHQDEIARIGQKLERSPSWTCTTARWVQRAEKFNYESLKFEVSDAERAKMKLDSNLEYTDWSEVEGLDMLELPPLEAAKVVNSFCSLRQF